MARILVADDDAHMLRVLSMWLTRNGHEVIEAGNGRQAQTLLDEQFVDLVISDVNMPLADGFELVQWLRQQGRASLPVVLLTSRCDQQAIIERLAGLNVNVCPKPFSPSRLVVQIEQLLVPVTAGS